MTNFTEPKAMFMTLSTTKMFAMEVLEINWTIASEDIALAVDRIDIMSLNRIKVSFTKSIFFSKCKKNLTNVEQVIGKDIAIITIGDMENVMK